MVEGKGKPTRVISPCLEFALERKVCASPTPSGEGSGQAEGISPKMCWGNTATGEMLGPAQGLVETVWPQGPGEAKPA